MSHFNQGLFLEQVSFVRRTFAQAEGLPLSQVLSEEPVADVLRRHGLKLAEPIYSALVTTWMFLSQVLSADSSMRAVVARLLAHRLGKGQGPCSSNTGGYCQARQRLPEGFLADLVTHTGTNLDAQAEAGWRWKGRDVRVFDGSTVSMPDTPANQASYPQPRSQAAGCGFPLARIGVLFSLAVGAVVAAAICPYKGKGNSELGLLRQIWHHLTSGTVLLADRYLCSWFEMVLLKQRGVDGIFRLHQARRVNWRRGPDQQLTWRKPPRPFWMDVATYRSLPDAWTVRVLRFRAARRGFRTRYIALATTLLDQHDYSLEDLAQLYRLRWHAELDLRCLKTVLQMDVLRGNSPDIVRKEIWAHLLAYNLIRIVMAQAALAQGLNPRSISFKATIQMLSAFGPLLANARGDKLLGVHAQLLRALATHVVGDRPNRYEPRARKRRPKPYSFLTQPRAIARKRLLCNK